ncbi:MAG: Rad52/Rad22 family DNA repair protein [Pseudomonadota bacterium]
MDSKTIESLAAPFDPAAIEWRVGSTNSEKTRGMALAYIDARHVMDRLDNVLGTDGWQAEYTPMPNGSTCCRIGVRNDSGWVWKSNGAGETSYEGVKGAYSDAFKRAAVLWGIGRYLYAIESPWVEITKRGNSFIINQSQKPKLRAVLAGEKQESALQFRDKFKIIADAVKQAAELGNDAIDQVLRDNQATLDKMPDGWRSHWDTTVGAAREQASSKEAA